MSPPSTAASYSEPRPVTCPWPILDVTLKSRLRPRSHLPTWPSSPGGGRTPSLPRRLQEQPEKTTGKGALSHRVNTAHCAGATDTAIVTSCRDEDPAPEATSMPSALAHRVWPYLRSPADRHIPAAGIPFATTLWMRRPKEPGQPQSPGSVSTRKGRDSLHRAGAASPRSSPRVPGGLGRAGTVPLPGRGARSEDMPGSHVTRPTAHTFSTCGCPKSRGPRARSSRTHTQSTSTVGSSAKRTCDQDNHKENVPMTASTLGNSSAGVMT